jgi:DNA-binding protein H-NS
MARKSLRPHLNQIRTWSRQGRTDAWVAHQLEVTVQQIESFKRENGLLEDEPGHEGAVAAAFDDEIDLRAEDDALIAAELEAAEQARREAEEAQEAERLAREAQLAAEAETAAPSPKRRSRGGGRGRAKADKGPLEGTFEHGEEGYGLWLDPAITDNPLYAEHWAGHRPVTVTIEEDQIVIRRSE